MLGNSNVAPTIAVKDLKAASQYYEQVLGLEKIEENQGGITYKSGQGKLFLYPSEYAGTNRATYAGWAVRDLEAVVEALKDKGVKFEQYDDLPGVTREGDIHVMGDYKMVWFKDLDGNIFVIDNSAKE